MMDEALEHLVKGIVDNPEDVMVKEKTHRRGTTLEVRVAIAGRTVRVDLIETDEAR